MVCSIAENRPLRKLQAALGVDATCHSWRANCIHRLRAPSGDYALGIPGAALGYCQALFNRSRTPAEHTEKVMRLLKGAGAPWAYSHELFWGYRQSESPEDYIVNASSPLLGAGRIPILITGLDPAVDECAVLNLLRASPPLSPNESMLVRVVLKNGASIEAIARILVDLVSTARVEGKMPKCWPLIQATLDIDDWRHLRFLAGSAWEFINIAVNPFTSADVLCYLNDQITVAQIIVGRAEEVVDDGYIGLVKEMNILGASERSSYSLPKYFEQLGALNYAPTLIVLGPAQEGWSDSMNQERVAALLPLLAEGCRYLWRDLGARKIDEVLRLSA